jgi:hypothetical protein
MKAPLFHLDFSYRKERIDWDLRDNGERIMRIVEDGKVVSVKWDWWISPPRRRTIMIKDTFGYYRYRPQRLQLVDFPWMAWGRRNEGNQFDAYVLVGEEEITLDSPVTTARIPEHVMRGHLCLGHSGTLDLKKRDPQDLFFNTAFGAPISNILANKRPTTLRTYSKKLVRHYFRSNFGD